MDIGWFLSSLIIFPVLSDTNSASLVMTQPSTHVSMLIWYDSFDKIKLAADREN